MSPSASNPLRQVIINTHSPAVAAQVPEGALLAAIPQSIDKDAHRSTVPAFRWLPGTWRAQAWPAIPAVPLGQVISYLNPLEAAPVEELEPTGDNGRRPLRSRRVIDRDDIQRWLPFAESSQAS
jgi:hypothetical protein